MDDDEIDIEGDDDMGIGNDRTSIPHHHVHTPSDSFLSELPETSSWILDSFGDWNVDDDQKSKDFHNMLQEEEYYFHSRHLDAPRHHLSPAKHAHAHHTLSHSPTDGSSEKSENSKKRVRVLFQSHSDDDGSEDSGKKGDGNKKARTVWSADEQKLFREAIDKFGKDYRKVQIHVGTRTIGQVRSHAQKYFQKQKSSTSALSTKPSQSTPGTSSSTNKHSPITSASPDAESSVPSAKSGSESDGPAPSGESSSSNASAAKGSSRGASAAGNGKHLPSHNTPWTTDEQKAFTEGLGMYGKGNWKVISNHIGSRTPLQVKNHARQYFKKMAKMGVNIEIETKPKVVVEKERKKKADADKPMQALLEVVRPQIIRKEYVPEEEDEEIDILGEEGNESPVEPNAVESEMKIKSEENSESNPKAKESDTHVPLSPAITKSGSDEHEVPSRLGNDANQNTTDMPAHETTPEPHTTHHPPPHQCTKCNHICNNCSNNNNTNNNNNTTNNNTENNEYEEMEDESGFERHIDCPTPTEEKVFDVDTVSPEEMAGNREFFCGNSAKTPERYLKIRNTIVDQWLKHKPKYLSKTSVRTSLKDCGDVNAIGRVHEFLELTGAINFGADRPPRHRHPPSTYPRLSTTPHQPLSPSPFPSSHPTTCTHVCTHHVPEIPEEITGPRKRRVRTRTGEWSYEDDQPTTVEHKPSADDGQEYEQKFASLNAKYFVEEDDTKKKLPRNKRSKYTAQDSVEDVLPYDPFRLIPCSRTLPPILPTSTTPSITPSTHTHTQSTSTTASTHAHTQSTSTSFTLSVQSTALVIMDTHAHMATTEVLGLLGGTYDADTRHVHVALAVPCESTSSTVQCEMDPQSQVVAREGLAARGLLVVGWYHSHPAFAPCPSIRDIETQALYQKVCTSPFVGIIVSPYDPRHPSDVSLFNYIVVGDEWSVNHEYQIPYEVPRTIVSDLPTPALFKQIADIINKYRTYKYRVDMNKMFRRGERLTCFEKMLRSISGHYFVSQGVSGDEQALLVSKIRNLFQKIEKSEKAAKPEKSEKSGAVVKSDATNAGTPKSEKADASQTEGVDKSKSTGKRKKDLMQLHQQQQQQRILQQQTQQTRQTQLHITDIPQPPQTTSHAQEHTPTQAQHANPPSQSQAQQTHTQAEASTQLLQTPASQAPHTHAETQAQPSSTQPHATAQGLSTAPRVQPPSPSFPHADQLPHDQKHLHPQVPIKIQQKQQRHQQTASSAPSPSTGQSTTSLSSPPTNSSTAQSTTPNVQSTNTSQSQPIPSLNPTTCQSTSNPFGQSTTNIQQIHPVRPFTPPPPSLSDAIPPPTQQPIGQTTG